LTHSVLHSLVVIAAIVSASPARAATPDGLITSKTKLSLWTTAGVRSGTVHVDTVDGAVTLYGKVPTSEQKTLAEKTTRAITDVRSVNNLLQVVAAADEKRVAMADKDIQAAVEKRLKAEPALKDSKISVKSVDKGVVLLSGEARTFSDHLRAVIIANLTSNVRRVASEVTAPDAFGTDERIVFLNKTAAKAASETKSSATDMRISAAVKLRLFTAPQVPSTEINVDTEEGVVTLFGIVPTSAVRMAAGVEAGKVAGVMRIENNLEVVPSNLKEVVVIKDGDVAKDLALAFGSSAELKGVTTTVKAGVVRLTGTVASGWDELYAVRVARKVSGVRAVEDQIKIETPTEAKPRN
jgi:hyperosmotically inducible protein